ncbi:MAG: diguanylate cyclase [Mycobacteriales bacterium]
MHLRQDGRHGAAGDSTVAAPLWLLALTAGLLYGVLAMTIMSSTSYGSSLGAVFWPGAGVTVAFLLRLPFRQWPAIVGAVALAEIVADLLNDLDAATAVGWAVANTAEAALGAWLFRRRGRVPAPLVDLGDLVRFLACCVVAGPVLGATIGTLTATLTMGDPVWPRLARWFVGDAIGVLVVAPALLGLRGRGMGAPTTRMRLWSLLGILVVSVVGLGPWRVSESWGLPFLVLAALVLISLWQGHGWAAGGVLVVASAAEVTTAFGLGPFALRGPFHGLVVAQMFIAACALTALLVAALTSDLMTKDEVERVLREQAMHDQLTGLANRRLFAERFEQAAGRALRHSRAVGVAVVDLDDFKGVNDRYGHTAGDAVLVETARRMQDEVRSQDTVARLGGDEFVVLLDGVDEPALADHLAQRLERSLNRPVFWQGSEVPVAASIGMAVSRPGGEPLDALISQADVLMYAAKSGRSDAAQVPSARSDGERVPAPRGGPS